MNAWPKNRGFGGLKNNIFELWFCVCFVTATNEKAVVYGQQGSGNWVFFCEKMKTHTTKYKNKQRFFLATQNMFCFIVF